jgi:hypothetical protein
MGILIELKKLDNFYRAFFIISKITGNRVSDYLIIVQPLNKIFHENYLDAKAWVFTILRKIWEILLSSIKSNGQFFIRMLFVLKNRFLKLFLSLFFKKYFNIYIWFI